MRIIAGEKRGFTIAAPEGMNTRPTQDRVREAVFGMFQFDIPGSRVLDLFAGSGAMGLESLSRGAAFAIFNDASKASIEVVRANIIKLGFTDKSRVLNYDCINAVKALSASNAKFDFIFIDPPYRSGIYEEVLTLIMQSKLLSQNGSIIVERSNDVEISPVLGLISKKQKNYGKTTIEVFNE